MLAAVAVVLAGGCSRNTTAPAVRTQVAAVVPTGGETGVDPTAPITMTFSGPMGMGMEQYVALHEGDVTGPEVAGAYSWSPDRTRLTFTPQSPLQARTTYTLHLGGGLMDADGDEIGYQACIQAMGGEWATQQIMGGMMGGMMGPGWRNPNGTYGMLFTFTTG